MAKSSSLVDLTIVGSPIQTYSINGCHDLTLSGLTIDNHKFNLFVKCGPNYSLGYNTDGFDISATNGRGITDLKYTTTITALSSTMAPTLVSRIACVMAITGSIKAGVVVDGVTISTFIVTNSDNAVRTKAYPNAAGGKVNSVTYTNINISSVRRYGIVIEQDYSNGGPTRTPGGASVISNINLGNIHSTMSREESVQILCVDRNSFSYKEIAISRGEAPNCVQVFFSL
ncbi:hypothetical protein BGZ46_009727 [Entomortierella lignicola]|nr:hypothetical protein BGZ46_009727 [Entomortierella lignicola]